MLAERGSHSVKVLVWHYPNRKLRGDSTVNDRAICQVIRHTTVKIMSIHLLLGPDTSILCIVMDGSRHRDASAAAGRCVTPDRRLYNCCSSSVGGRTSLSEVNGQ